MKNLSLLLVLASILGGCAGQVEAEPSPTELECEQYFVCREDATATWSCLDGDCGCVTSNPGENRARSCASGEPDGRSRNPWLDQ